MEKNSFSFFSFFLKKNPSERARVLVDTSVDLPVVTAIEKVIRSQIRAWRCPLELNNISVPCECQVIAAAPVWSLERQRILRQREKARKQVVLKLGGIAGKGGADQEQQKQQIMQRKSAQRKQEFTQRNIQ